MTKNRETIMQPGSFSTLFSILRFAGTLRTHRIYLAMLVVCTLVSCGGNQYGHARVYEPLSEEEEHFENASMASYEEVRRNPEAFMNQLIGWFGIVESIKTDQKGTSIIGMSLRYHQERHLCFDQFDSSCRVTVSERTGGPFSAIATLRTEDLNGENRVYEGSLLKIYGKPSGDFDDAGGPILKTIYYRHWPRNTYVTTASKRNMRR